MERPVHMELRDPGLEEEWEKEMLPEVWELEAASSLELLLSPV